jgi:PHD/YefM family antitoxin component YafN of YafNO toxin-antitoxin module
MKPIIKPSSELRRNYNAIATVCKESHAPVFLTKNGEGDTVIMDIATYSRREEELSAALRLIQAKMDRLNGVDYVTVDEFESDMRDAISKGSRYAT